MSNTNIASLYEYTLQQMAAESYFEGVPLANVGEVRRRLTLGTNRLGYPSGAGDSNSSLNQGYPGYTRMTGVQADEFLAKFAIVHQWSDDPTPTGTRAGASLGPGLPANTGLSATLIRKKGDNGALTNEYTLAIRSTEFLPWAEGGDAQRDKDGADVDGIVKTGFALAQQAALESYYRWLRQTGNLPPGAVLDVTGYSLGGHLATVFTEMHRADSDLAFGEAVTFNGAGRGVYDAAAGSLANMVAYFQSVLVDPTAAAEPANEVARYWRNGAIAAAASPFDAKSLYGDLRYAWAQYATAVRFGLKPSVFANDPNALATAPITQVFGFETINNFDFTANSAIHGRVVAVGIESQSLFEGAAGSLVRFASDRLAQFIGGDFGAGHSIALIADSLALQRAMNKLAPDFRLEDFIPILMKATNRVQSNGPGANYEVDALENILDGLRRQLVVPTTPKTPYKEGAGGFGDIAKRETYYNNLKALTDSAAFRSLSGSVQLRASDTLDLAGRARSEFSAMTALLTLSPVSMVASGLAARAVVETALQGVWGTAFSDWQADRNLSASQRNEGAEVFTRAYIDDRAGMLGWLLTSNAQNGPATDSSNRIQTVTGTFAQTKPLLFEDTALAKSVIVLPRVSTVAPSTRVVFGSDGNDSLVGQEYVDHLYGGAGNDTVNGLSGNDYLESNAGADSLFGGSGNDTLLGGADDDNLDGGADADSLLGGSGSDILDGGPGNDTLYGGDGMDVLQGGAGNDFLYGGANNDGYFFAAGWGSDTIEDIDGIGAIEVEGFGRLGELARRKVGEGEWVSVDGRVRFTVVPGTGASQLEISFAGLSDSLHVKNWVNGGLGITLDGAVTPPVTNEVFVGDFNKQTSGSVYEIVNGNYVNGGGLPLADDEITGGSSADLILGMLGNDALAGMAGADDIEGGDGDDLLLGGLGADVLNGGAGRDVIFGSGAGGLVLPRSVGEAPPVADGPEITRGFSWVTFDAGADANGFAVLKVKGADIVTLADDDGNLIDAGAGDDYVYAGFGDDIVHGGTGNDYVSAMRGDDTVFGDDGADDLEGDGPVTLGYVSSVYAADHGDDVLVGGAGNDTLSGDGGDDALYGGDDDDFVFGDDPDPSVIPFANHGNDYLDGGAGADELVGGGGDDELFGGTGKDNLFGDASLATLPGQYHGADYLDGEDADDYLEGGGGQDTLYGGEGHDVLWGDASSPGLTSAQYGADYLDGEAGDDTLNGGGKGDTLFGGDGDDALLGDGDGPQVGAADNGADHLDGGAGNDYLRGDGKSDTLIGSAGNDYLVGDGDNVQAVDEGEDFLDAGAGNDTLLGNGGNDYLDAGDGDDNLYGGAGDDYLDGGAGDDYLEGNGGNDTLVGGAGTDIMRGGAGDDTYVVSAADSPLSALGWSEAIVDNEGRNVVVFDGVGSAGIQVVADANGTLQIVAPDGESIVVQNGVSGSIESYRFSDGRSFSSSELIGSFADASGSDTGSDGRRRVIGGRRNESLGASGGGSVLSGGRGDDTLTGSGGNNTYRFSRGDGSDLLVDTSAKTNAAGEATPNQVVFGAGIARSDLRLTGAAGALRIQVGADPGDSVTLGGFEQANALAAPPIDTFVFADGSSMSYADLLARGFDANDGGDTVSASAGDDRIAGGDGDDVLEGKGGNDMLRGGAGNDSLSGGDGSDRYIFAAGDGQDVIDNAGSSAGQTDALLLNAIDPADVLVARSGDDLVIRLRNSVDRITVARHFAGAAIGRVEFDGGEAWGAAEIAARLSVSLTDGPDNVIGTDGNDAYDALGGDDTVFGAGGDDVLDGGAGSDRLDGGTGADSLRGGAGGDTLSGGEGDDVLEGGAGNDALFGGEGNDRYLFARGGGQDTISNTDTAPAKLDSLVFADVVPADITTSRIGNDVILSIAGSSDAVRLTAFLDNEGENKTRVEEVRFADGTLWTWQQIRDRVSTIRGTSGNDYLLGTDAGNERIDGEGGNDTIYGKGGADTLLGGPGEDYVDGGDGDDRLEGGSGIDTLFGGAGSDTFVDGERMFDSSGDDTYVLTSIAGVVQIDDAGGSDVLVLPATASPAAARVDVGVNSGIGSVDYLDLKVAGGIVLVSKYFASLSGAEKIEQIRFADGTTWTVADVLARLPVNNFSEGNDSANGFRWDDSLNALAGDDTVNAGAGNDTVDGASGNDWLNGGPGDDSLLGGQGDDLAYGEDGNDFLFGGSGRDVLYGDGNWTLVEGADFLDGGDGDDELYGEGGDDTLTGGRGNDTLSGALGNDTFLLGRDSGRDRLDGLGQADRIRFDAAVDPSDVTLFRDGNALIVAIGQTQAQARVAGLYGSAYRFEFASGAVWDAAEIASRTVAGAADAMVGTAGDDTFVVDDAGDTIAEAANAGDDTVLSSVSYALGANLENLTLTGYADVGATGNELANRLTGNAGSNVLDGRQGGRDTMAGGAGDDTYYAHLDTAAIVEAIGEGTDTVIAPNFSYALPANVENLTVPTLRGGYIFPVHLTGNDLDNLIIARNSNAPGAYAAITNDVIDGGPGADTMVSGAIDDLFYVDNPGDTIVASSARVFSSIDWTLAPGHSALTLIGSAPIGATGNDRANTLDGAVNPAANVLVGGAGDDTYRLGAGDTVVEQPGGGTDTVVFAYRPVDGVIEIGSAGSTEIERFTIDRQLGAGLTLRGSSRGDVITYSENQAGGTVEGLAGNDTLTGGFGRDRLEGGDGDDRIDGDIGDDTLVGGAGNDTLIGGAGDNTLDGGAGDDLVDGSVQATYLFGRGDGRDVIAQGDDRAGRQSVLRFKTGIGSSEISATQVGADLLLRLTSGGEQIRVQSFFLGDDPSNRRNPLQRVEFADGTVWGLDTLRRLAHPDAVNSSPTLAAPLADVVRTEWAIRNFDPAQPHEIPIPPGTFVDPDVGDTLTYSASLADGSPLPASIGFTADRIVLSTSVLPGSYHIKVTAVDGGGLAASDVFDLNVVAEGGRLYTGTARRDTLTGLTGNDTLLGLDGDDLLDGGAGSDSMVGGRGSDVYLVDDPGDVVVENADEGDDLIWAWVGYSLPADVERLSLFGTAPVSATGNEQSNTIQGNAGDNTLDGGRGADTFYGGGGNDTFVVDDPGDVIFGRGTIRSSISWRLSGDVRTLVLSGSGAIDGTGTSEAETLVGNSASNRLAGGGGADTLIGGAGDDTYAIDGYLVNGTGESIVEQVGEGIDTVEAKTTWTLGANLERLVLVGNSAGYLFGNELANTLIGNAASNYLVGGAGADTLIGGGGDDAYVVDDAGDVVVESAAGGIDRVDSSITYRLGAELEKLTLTGAADIDGFGNDAANTLIGNAGANRLDGGAGADTMAGDAGDDTYVVDNAGDVINELLDGFDTIESELDWTLGINLERLLLTGSAAVYGTGSRSDNVLIGNGASNVLRGYEGNDTLSGAGGNDTLDGGAGDDTYLFERGFGTDVIDSNDSAGGKLDTLLLGAGIAVADVALSRTGNDLIVALAGGDDSMRVRDQFVGPASRIDYLRFADGTEWTPADMSARLGPSLLASTDRSQALSAEQSPSGKTGLEPQVDPSMDSQLQSGAPSLVEAMAGFGGDGAESMPWVPIHSMHPQPVLAVGPQTM